jgi:hypothetical protein
MVPVDIGTGVSFRAGREHGPASLSRRLCFGGPFPVPIGPNDVRDDPDLLTFIRAEAATTRYVLVHSAVSFCSEPGDPQLHTAAVRMSLSDRGGGPGVVAWSLMPTVLATPVETKRAFSVGPTLKLHGTELSAGSITGETTRDHDEFFLSATGLLTGYPGWDFKRTASVDLHGTHRLVMIVRAATGRPAQLSVTLAASVRTGKAPKLFRKTLELAGPNGPMRELTL